MITAISPIGFRNNIGNAIQKSNSCSEPQNNLDKSSLQEIPSSYHNAMFKANQKLSKISFAGLPKGMQMLQLKSTLNKVCEETIEKYTSHDLRVSQNLFTRGYIQHCFDFVEKAGDDLHNTHDPLGHSNWAGFMNFKRKTTSSGFTLEQNYKRLMTEKMDSWNERFIDIITQEKAENKNNLLDELLDKNGDLGGIKSRLGIDF